MPQQIVMDLTRSKKKSTGVTIKNRSPKKAVRAKKIAASSEGYLRIISLGGLEEVGRNMNAFEWVGENGKSEIMLLDAGIGFPLAEEMPGIDFVIPNTEYIESKKESITGILITHGHYDHIGALPFILGKIGNPPIYATPLTKGLILKRQQDYPHTPKPEIIEINKDDPKPFKVGVFEVECFHVNHSIPDAVGFFIKTPVGNIMHTGDFKIDFAPIFDKPANLSHIAEIASRGVRLLMSDSTNSTYEGHVKSERVIMENLESVVKHAEGRIIAATFASLLERVQQIIYLAHTYNKKIVVEGHSMRMNVEIAKNLGYLKFAKGAFIKPEAANKLPDNQVIIICTGAQAEENAVLARIANKEHKFFTIKPKDTVVFSASIIPGNERSVQNLKDLLTKQGAKIMHNKMIDVHVSGHAFMEDIRLFMNLVHPENVMPIHGNYYMLKGTETIARETGVPTENIFITQNGGVIEMRKEGIAITDERIISNLVFVDGIGVGDVGEVVLRDRQTLAKDGMFIVIVSLDTQNGQMRVSPDIISRGFVYLRESKELLREVRSLIRRVIAKNVKFLGDEAPIIEEEKIKFHLKEEIASLLFKKTQRTPVIIPVVIKI